MMKMVVLAALPLLVAASDWSYYGGDSAGRRYSTAKQVNRQTVSRLAPAWEYHTGALRPETELNRKAAFECTPVLFNGVLYLTTPYNEVIALDAASGREKWKYDPHVDRSRNYSEVASRGVAVWVDQRSQAAAACHETVFEGTIDARLISVDARTGKPCEQFGKHGALDLTADVELRNPGEFQVTSAPTVVKDVVITGSSIGDNRALAVERGIVRGYDVRTGKLLWGWDPIPWRKDAAVRTGAANAWSTISADLDRGLIFVPTGSAAPDFYGGLRPGNDENANSVSALRAATGERLWSYQVVHHDLWDYDVAAQPALITFRGRPAVAVATKMGLLFVLDRETGKPLHEVNEVAVPKSDVPGELTSPTQPIPAWDALMPLHLRREDLAAPTPEALAVCRKAFEGARNEGPYTPPSLQGTLVFPGNAGGVNWGSVAVDEARGLLFANTNRLAGVIRLIRREDLPARRKEAADNRFFGEFGEQAGTPYAMYRDWLIVRKPSISLCNQPPWGALVAYDLAAGKRKWEAPLGSFSSGAKTGMPNLGGPIVTAGGLVFTAAAMDHYLRAFDEKTGEEVWRAELPASAQSTPMTYTLDGNQFVVICAGGHGKLGTKQGDSVVAFALR